MHRALAQRSLFCLGLVLAGSGCIGDASEDEHVGASFGALSTTLSASADTSITNRSPDYASGGSALVAIGGDNGGYTHHALIKFDLSGFQHADVTAATLGVYVSRVPAGGTADYLMLRTLTQSWTEGAETGNGAGSACVSGATWNRRSCGGFFWSTAGGVLAGNNPGYLTYFTTSTAAEWATWNVTASVDSMTPGTNNGWLINGWYEPALKSARAFNSRESGSNTPYLSLTFTCDTGYYWWVWTQDCLVDTSFCSAISVTNGSTVYTGGESAGNPSYNSTATTTCSTGYVRSGAAARTCTAGGTWSSANPTCNVSNSWCAYPSVTNGGYSLSGGIGTNGFPSYNSTATYSCSAGYQNNGSASGVCQSNQTWSASPSCGAISSYCSSVASIGVANGSWGAVSGGIAGTTTTSLNAQATYTCNTGYTGGGTTTCNAGPAWSAISTCSVSTSWCAAPAISNASYSLSGGLSNGNRSYNATATYTCSAGYENLGSASGTCQANQSWSALSNCQIDATYCGSLPSMSSGSWGSASGGLAGGTTYSMNAQITYTCGTGYTGGGTATCQSNGTWSTPTSCSVVTPWCASSPSNVSNGSYLLAAGLGGYTNTYGATATYSCNGGYTVSGSNPSSCQANQSWSTAPSCAAVSSYCPVVPTVTNASAGSPTGGAGGGSTRSVNATVTYTCSGGYSLSGTNPITCQSNAAWTSGPTCSVISDFCGTAPSVTNSTGAPTVSGGAAGGSTNSVGATATYACATGYALSGGSTSTCSSGGSWSTAPTCVVDTAWCSAAPSVSNAGTAVLTGGYGGAGTTSYQASATYACNGGYSGGGSSTCQASRSWSASPTCSVVSDYCGTPQSVTSGSLSSVSGGAGGGSTNSVGAIATYACDAGYAFSGGATATCGSGGTWSTAPTCAPVSNYCGVAPTVLNSTGSPVISGGAAGGATRSLGATASYTCSTGYTKSGSDAVCQSGGSWSAAPTCTADVAWCSAAPSVTNAGTPIVAGGVGGTTTPSYLATATYTCNGGYAFSAGSTSTCQASHAWSTSPTCAAVSNYCGAPPSVTNSASTSVAGGAAGGSTNSVGATATFTCSGGYSLSGGSTSTCQTNGAWTAAPTCAAVSNYCGAPPSVTNSAAPTVGGGSGGGATNSVGATATYACSLGYSQSGANPTCQSNGSWSTAPTCVSVNCGTAPIVANAGTASVSGGNGGGATTTYGATAAYACDDGYAFSGSNSTCQVDGTWSAPPACGDIDECLTVGLCAPGTCNNFPGTHTCDCPMGYVEFGGQCIVQNACTEDLDDCLPIADCSSSDLVSWVCSCPSGYTGDGVTACTNVDECSNGALNDCDAPFATCTDTVGSFTCGCQAGYLGDGVTACNVVGNYCGSPSTVTNASAPSVAGGAAGAATFSLNATATYACDTGYAFVGGSTSTCQANASWSAAPTCAAIANFCGGAPMVSNAAGVSVSGGIGGAATTSMNATAAYTCNLGFSKSGADPTCLSSGSWSTAPTCDAVANYCGAPPSVANSGTPTVSGGSGGGSTYSLAAVAAYTCNAGYAKSGADASCQSGGTWSAPPTCTVVANFCGTPAVVTNASVPTVAGGDGGGATNSIGATATYACDAGYAFSAGSTSTCGASASWSSAPTCVPVSSFCGAPPTVPNAATAVVSGGIGGGSTPSLDAVAAYTCDAGYSKSGGDPVCGASGSWSASPSCVADPAWCAAAPGVSNAGAATLTGGLGGDGTTSLDATATYACNTGYAFTGGSTSTCGASRAWSTAPVCAVLTSYCGAPPMVTNAGAPSVAGGIGGTTTSSLGAIATYACDAGYAFVAGATSTCVAGGSWSGSPSCAAVANYCNTPPAVANAAAPSVTGGISGPGTNSLGATAAYVCASGFDLVGTNPTCGSSGAWGIAPTCVPRDCGAPPMVSNAAGVSVSGGAGGLATPTYGATAAYTCNSGFALSGAPAVCQASGSWSAAPLCDDVDECATLNGGCGDPTFWGCANNVGAAPTCSDIDECATNNGGCGSALFYTCANVAGAAPTCADIDECSISNGGCGDATFYACTNVDGGPPVCGDVDECATLNGGCGDPTYWSCTNNVGTAASCADIDECASSNGGCGAAIYVVCTNVSGAAPICADIDECATGNGGCGDPVFYTCTNVAIGPPVCGDIDECATLNGGCGDPTYYSCANQTGLGAICTDIDECATGNGGCGDPTWNACTNVDGAAPTCADIDECATNNGGCGDPALMECTDQVAAPPLCADVDDCLTNTCALNATCADLPAGAFSCTCDAGYAGDGTTSCADIDECVAGTDDCALTPNSHCANFVPGFSCDCDTGFRKVAGVCVDIDECSTTQNACGDHEDCVNNVAAAPTCVCSAGYARPAAGQPCVFTCGEGVRAGAEQCDDGNTVDGDGCSSRCLIERGWACHEPTATTSTCDETCGDGRIQPPYEQCDDGAQNSDMDPNACHSNCRSDGCGDGMADPGEQCDDGLDNSDDVPDACRMDCRDAFCGDGVFDTARGEVCDPGGGAVLDDALCATAPCTRPTDAGVDAGAETGKGRGCGCHVAGSDEATPLTTWLTLTAFVIFLGLRRRARSALRGGVDG